MLFTWGGGLMGKLGQQDKMNPAHAAPRQAGRRLLRAGTKESLPHPTSSARLHAPSFLRAPPPLRGSGGLLDRRAVNLHTIALTRWGVYPASSAHSAVTLTRGRGDACLLETFRTLAKDNRTSGCRRTTRRRRPPRSKALRPKRSPLCLGGFYSALTAGRPVHVGRRAHGATGLDLLARRQGGAQAVARPQSRRRAQPNRHAGRGAPPDRGHAGGAALLMG